MINTIGIIAAVLTTSAFLPQAIRTIKTRETESLSLTMYLLMSVGNLLWLIYGILSDSIPVILANAITVCFVVIILIFKIIDIVNEKK
ncbi:SemiSWEET transporter [Lactococcus sp.]|uniref:SemiSWEET transporter n=1 Tax=Lactococcus sp. TaxID=44273 RepID=UPI0035B150AC